jgi:CRISPR/Cas system CSM-associated protein Csm5 (group 7 of RAMP superfamily)
MGKPKQERLPGVENKLKDLHECAMEYAEKRDERQAIGREEVALKAKLLGLMKKHKLDNYEYEDVSIEVVIEEETVKVKVKKHKDEDEEDAA